MGHRNTISGHIQEPWHVAGSERETHRLWDANKRVIHSLPVKDEWPFLSKRMFSFSPTFDSGSAGITTSTYRGRVIYFGGSFSAIYTDWPEWLRKFETLLRQLYWEHAAVLLITEWVGKHTYHWEADFKSDSFAKGNPSPVSTWKFTGGPRDFDSA